MLQGNNCCAPKARPRKNGCSCSVGKVNTVLACCGSSNVGQITNETAKELDRAGQAKFFCLAGVGGHVSGMVESVRAADAVLVLDGCTVGCGKKCMDAAGLPGYTHLVVTELGIEKKHVFDLAAADKEAALAAARDRLGSESAAR